MPPDSATPSDVRMPPGGREVTVGASRLSRWLDGFAERHGAVEVTASAEVVALSGADGARAWIAVPFPPLNGDLVSHVSHDRRVGAVLVRRGGYAVGVFDGDEMVSWKVGTGHVQGTTKAGGWSQQRYARRRANQAASVLARASDACAAVLLDTRLDALVAGGDRPAVTAVLADRRLSDLPAPTEPWLQVKDPRLRVLVPLPEQFRAVRIRLDP